MAMMLSVAVLESRADPSQNSRNEVSAPQSPLTCEQLIMLTLLATKTPGMMHHESHG